MYINFYRRPYEKQLQSESGFSDLLFHQLNATGFLKYTFKIFLRVLLFALFYPILCIFMLFYSEPLA